MERIELKHLTSYLPYSLGIQHKYTKAKHRGENHLRLWQSKLEPLGLTNLFYDNGQGFDFHLLLRPLSDLTKEIEINGEKFVPIIALTKIVAGIYNDDQDDKFFIKDDGRILVKTPWDLRVEMFYKTPSIDWAVYDTWNHEEKRTRNQYLAMEKLFEWHFDVFGLIEKGLAIDISTLNK